MKKLLIFILSFIFVFMLVACDDEVVPEGEYTLSVEGENSLLYEPLKSSYKAGEKVIVKTNILMDASVQVRLNGERIVGKELIEDENGHYLYNQSEFVMPAQNSVLSLTVSGGMLPAPAYEVTLLDHDKLVVNSIDGEYEKNQAIEIHTSTENVLIKINGVALAEKPQAVNGEGQEVLYYKSTFTMPKGDVTVEVAYAEPPLYTLSYRGYDGDVLNIFDNSFGKQYAHGDVVKLFGEYDILDAEILLKANGIKIEEIDYGEWQFTMPAEDVTVCAYLINTSWGENWHYLNVEDREGMLNQIADRYYKEDDTVELYATTLLNIEIKSGTIADLEYEYISSGKSRYRYTFTMPKSDVTIKVSINEYEPYLMPFTFRNETGISKLFNTLEKEYAPGDVITVTVNPKYLVEDQGIILKINGKTVKQTGTYEWQITMPDDALTVCAYSITWVSWIGDYYVDIEDPQGLLAQIADGYYMETTSVTLYAKAPITVEDVAGNTWEMIAGRKNELYTYTFNMPSRDISLIIKEGKKQSSISTLHTLTFVSRIDGHDLFANDISGTYEAGEEITITAKTYVIQHPTKLFIDGVELVSTNGSLEWTIIMPNRDITVYAYIKDIWQDCFLSVEDEYGLIINTVDGFYESPYHRTAYVRTLEKNVVFELNGKLLEYALEPVRNDKGEIMYYSQGIPLNSKNSTLKAYRTGKDYYCVEFQTDLNIGIYGPRFYEPGEVVTFPRSPLSIKDGQGYIVKVNGIAITGTPEYGSPKVEQGGNKLEEAMKEELLGYQWSFVMPNEHVIVTITSLNSPTDETYQYLNVEDEELLLVGGFFYQEVGVVDGYYATGDIVTLYSRVEINLDADYEIEIISAELIESHGEEVYEYKFEMPNEDLTLKITKNYNQ